MFRFGAYRRHLYAAQLFGRFEEFSLISVRRSFTVHYRHTPWLYCRILKLRGIKKQPTRSEIKFALQFPQKCTVYGRERIANCEMMEIKLSAAGWFSFKIETGRVHQSLMTSSQNFAKRLRTFIFFVITRFANWRCHLKSKKCLKRHKAFPTSDAIALFHGQLQKVINLWKASPTGRWCFRDYRQWCRRSAASIMPDLHCFLMHSNVSGADYQSWIAFVLL